MDKHTKDCFTCIYEKDKGQEHCGTCTKGVSNWKSKLGTLKEMPNVEKLVGALRLILPMAKGYASEHNVGSNQKYIIVVENLLDSLNKEINNGL